MRMKGLKKGYFIITMVDTAEEVTALTGLFPPEILDAICNGAIVNGNQCLGYYGGLSTPEIGKLFDISHEMVLRLLEKSKDLLYTDRSVRAAYRFKS